VIDGAGKFNAQRAAHEEVAQEIATMRGERRTKNAS
jgi:hypothetical protein